MSAAPIQPRQIAAIHAIKNRVKLREDDYRAMLQGLGATSSKELTSDLAERLIRRMRDIPGADRPREARGPAPAGKYAGKLQALWISGWNLGVVRDRGDRAMHAFIERQTGLSHSRFLREAAAATRAIEALKAWLEREAGVDWSGREDDGHRDAMANRRAVLRAQWRRCLALGVITRLPGLADDDDALERFTGKVARGSARALGSLDCPSVTAEELDNVAKVLGAKIRAAQGGAAR